MEKLGGSLRKNVSWLLAVALLLVLAVVYYKQNIHASVPVRFIDQTGTISPAYVSRMNELLRGTFMETGVDMRFLIVRLEGQPMEPYAVEQARNMGIGAASDARGLLCVYDIKDRKMRIEVGPRLEGILTDAFVSYLERENMRAYVNAQDLQLGLRFTERLVLWRLRAAALGMEYDPRPAKLVTDRLLLAEGAGATESLAAPGGDLVNRTAPPDILQKYVSQPTVERAWEKYQEWLLESYSYTNVSLFTEGTQGLLAHMKLSRAYVHGIFLEEDGQPHKVIEVGDVAMLYFTHTPLVSPYYFRRTADGWVMDIVGSVRNSQEMIGASFTWRWRDGGDEYARAFLPYVVTVNGVSRIRGGDNRPLPVHDNFFNNYLKDAS